MDIHPYENRPVSHELTKVILSNLQARARFWLKVWQMHACQHYFPERG